MKRLSLRLTAAAALAAAAFLASPLAAQADGLFSGYPIVGGSSYCNSSVNGSCVSTIPAGPSPLGTERVPADTGLGQGRNPQTALLPSVALGGGAIQYAEPLTTETVTVAAAGAGTPAATTTTGTLILKPAGTIAALTVVLPPASALVDNQKLTITSTQIVTALTLTAGSGTSLGTAVTALAAGTPVSFIYRAADKTWYRR